MTKEIRFFSGAPEGATQASSYIKIFTKSVSSLVSTEDLALGYKQEPTIFEARCLPEAATIHGVSSLGVNSNADLQAIPAFPDLEGVLDYAPYFNKRGKVMPAGSLFVCNVTADRADINNWRVLTPHEQELLHVQPANFTSKSLMPAVRI